MPNRDGHLQLSRNPAHTYASLAQALDLAEMLFDGRPDDELHSTGLRSVQSGPDALLDDLGYYVSALDGSEVEVERTPPLA